jgi:glycosyltransferase involved in cell wall biosynthesis
VTGSGSTHQAPAAHPAPHPAAHPAVAADTAPGQHAPLLSVVIPAHNEARVLGRLLARLAPLAADGRAQVVVVANGCTDDTAAVARTRPGVLVLELPAAGKAGALNAGDQVATAFPRVYLDADVELDPAALLALAGALPDDQALVGAPTIRFELAGRPWPVRAYYRVFTQLPYAREGLVGLGVYAVSRSGRARFAQFPALTADDLFVQRHFGPDERRVLPDVTFTVHPPRSTASLVRVRTRAAQGAAELAAARAGDAAFASSAGDSVGALSRLVRQQPSLAPAAGAYIGITLLARARARTSGGRWERDDTTR